MLTEINFSIVKRNFVEKFPNNPLSNVLLRTPDILDSEEFLVVVKVLLLVLDTQENEMKRGYKNGK